MKRIILIILSLIMCFSLFSCGVAETPEEETTTKKAEEVTTEDPEIVREREALALAKITVKANIKAIAEQAYTDLINNYWDSVKGYFVDPYKEGGRDTYSDIMWVYVQLMLCLNTYYEVTGNRDAVEYIDKEMLEFYEKSNIAGLAVCATGNNPCMDDAAWTSMGAILHYRLTGNRQSLELAHKVIENAYNYWADDEGISNGLYYRLTGSNFKSLYCIGLMLSEMEYNKITEFTDDEDIDLHEKTLALYEFIEEYHYRGGQKRIGGTTYANDGLYYCDLYDWGGIENYPNGLGNNEQIGSYCALFANTGMAVLHMAMYKETGKDIYRQKAVALANTIAEKFNINDTYYNDRDAWTECAFIGYYAKEVMTLDGISDKAKRMFLNTTVSIMENGYYEGGFYTSDWSNIGDWTDNDPYGNPYVLTNSATTVHMIMATYYLSENDLLPITAEDVDLVGTSFTIQEPPSYINLTTLRGK